jgi:hypothetical protein
MSLAAVFGEECHQPPRALDIDRVKDAAFDAPRPQQSGAFELRQVMGQRRRRHGDARGDFPRRKAGRAFANEEPKDLQPVFLSQCRECCDCRVFFHISENIEITAPVKGVSGVIPA